MPKFLKLTKEQIDDLLALADLEDKEIVSFVETIKATTVPPLTPAQFREVVRTSLPGRSVGDSDRLLRSLLSMYRLRSTRGWSVPEVVEALLAGFAVNGPKDRVERLNALQSALEELASAPVVQIFAKALDLTYEHENLLQTARILTDVRPVFSQDGTTVEASVISYTLRLRYFGQDGLRSLTVALDGKDVDAIALQCDRAKKKSSVALELMGQKAGLPSVIAGEDEEEQ